MPPCTLASCGRRSQPESSQWASVLLEWQGDPLHHYTKKSNSTTRGLVGAGLGMAEVLRRGMFWKRPQCFCVAEGVSIEGAEVAGAAPMLFLFSALRTFGICVRPHKEIPQLHFPWSPFPPFEPARLPHICIKMKSCGDRMLLPYSSGCRGTIFIFVEHISAICSGIREVLN